MKPLLVTTVLVAIADVLRSLWLVFMAEEFWLRPWTQDAVGKMQDIFFRLGISQKWL